MRTFVAKGIVVIDYLPVSGMRLPAICCGIQNIANLPCLFGPEVDRWKHPFFIWVVRIEVACVDDLGHVNLSLLRQT